jgi:hypothetical protein
MITRLRRLTAGTHGSEIAEAALVLPIAFLILLSIYWFGRAFNVYATINHAARQGARYAVAQKCGSCGNQQPLAADVANQVSLALQAAHLDPASVVPGPLTRVACPGQTMVCSSSTSPAINYCTGVQLVPPPLALPSASGVPPCGVSIDFQYPYQMFLLGTSLNQAPYKLSAHVQMRIEQ